jgi:hypothetical protein
MGNIGNTQLKIEVLNINYPLTYAFSHFRIVREVEALMTNAEEGGEKAGPSSGNSLEGIEDSDVSDLLNSYGGGGGTYVYISYSGLHSSLLFLYLYAICKRL